jgi:hypothetical protein
VEDKDKKLYETFKSICGYNNLNLTNEISNQYFNDLGKLINSEFESNLSLNIDDETTVPVHKIILCRSPYFYSMFTSGNYINNKRNVRIKFENNKFRFKQGGCFGDIKIYVY